MRSFWVDSLTGGETHGLFVEHFRLRKRIFIDGLQWSLTERNEREFDQYDTPFASYCLVESEGQLVASARILPTDVENGPNSYMIRDAYLGRLGADLPPSLCEGFLPPTSADVWEATRLTVEPTLQKGAKKAALQTTINRMVVEAQRAKVRTMIAIGGIELALGVRMSGHQIERMTPYQSTRSGAIAVFEMPVIHF